MRHGPGGIWNDQRERLPGGFCLTKRSGDQVRSAVCEVWSNPVGWELRLMIDGHGLLVAAVVGSASEMLKTADEWRAAMLESGWS